MPRSRSRKSIKRTSFRRSTSKKARRHASFSSFSRAATTASRRAMKYTASLTTKQPFPDSWKCWMTSDAAGFVSGGLVNSTMTFAFGINALQLPYNQNNGLALIPNPLVALNTINPTGLKNILFNPTTSSGIYLYYRVWRTEVEVTIDPQQATDNVNAAIAPVPAGTNYSNTTGTAAGPNSTTLVCSGSGFSSANTLKGNWSIPALLGLSDAQYATAASQFTYASAATQFCDVFAQSNDNTNFVNALPVRIQMRQFVEFYSRIDTTLIVS